MANLRYNLIEVETGVPIKAWTKGVKLEDEAKKQLLNVAQLPFVYKWVAAMPDVHWGLGATIGSVIPTKGAIIPAAVGVDIGCGVMAVQTTLNANHLPDNLRNIRRAIEKAVPHGRTDHGGKRDKGAWGEIPRRQIGVWRQLEIGYKAITEKYPKLDRGNHVNHLGTLGTGNHFIELCLDENDQVWFMLHSGSRGVGNRIGTFFIEMAKNDMRAHIANLPDKDLAYFNEGSEHFEDYVEAVSWAQEFAMYNRKLMMEQIVDAVADSGEVPEFELTETAVNCHHNYCIPASEVIPTPDGPKSITQLNIGDKVYAFDAEKGLAEVEVKQRIFSGKKRIFTVRTDHRRIKVSGDHPLLTVVVELAPHPERAWHQKGVGSYVWKKAAELKVGDIVVCAQNYYDAAGTQLGADWARFIGAFLGDGWIRHQTDRGYTVGLAIGSVQESVTGKYLTLLSRQLFPDARWFNNVPGVFGLSCSSKAVHTKVKELELAATSAERAVPSYCFQLPLAEKRALLAGYLDADGCLTERGANFSSRSEPLAKGLRELAISCGLRCTNIKFTNRVTNFGPNPLYAFHLSPCGLSSLPLWHDGKRARIQETARVSGLEVSKLGYLELPDGFFAQRVRAIERSETVEDVYDIEVNSANHSFVCEGIVVHNCAIEEHYGEEVFVTRKGAVRARKGDMGIIPGSMGARSYIVRGMGNPESFMSCSHGAGRAMSRNEAKRRFTTADHEKATAGIECRKDEGVIDETPACYKPIEDVMNAQSDLVEIAHTLRQVVCVKG